MQILNSGLIQKYKISKVGIAGHPEGSPDISDKKIEDALFAGGDIITTDAGFNMCIYSDDDNAYRIVATNGDDKESGDYKEVVLTHNGLYDPEED